MEEPRVRFLDLRNTNPEERDEIQRLIESILDSGRILLGDAVKDFEDSLAHYCKRKYSIGVGSGTAGLYIAIKALNYAKDSEIITTPLSWVSSTNAIVLNGYKPVFCDVGLSLNIDPKSLERCLSRKTKAVLAVDFAGQLCDYKKIKNFCEENGLDLIQDASQAIGARSDIGIAGGIGTVSIISHNPMKILGAYGEAGSVLTDDKQIAEKLRQLRHSGTINREDCVEPSINARLDTAMRQS